mgnify:CR=1 FL=1
MYPRPNDTDWQVAKFQHRELVDGLRRLVPAQAEEVLDAEVGVVAPDVDDAGVLTQFFTVIQALNREGLLLAYHDLAQIEHLFGIGGRAVPTGHVDLPDCIRSVERDHARKILVDAEYTN